MKTEKLIITLFGAILAINAQAQLAMGGWRTHFSYSAVECLAQSDSKIFAITSGALMSVDKRDESVKLYSKITGLNDNNIQIIACDAETQKLVIIYQNGNIDLMTENAVINIPDFYLKQSNISKNVNHISFAARKAYLSTDFGIMSVNLDKKEIADTYYIGAGGAEVKVLATAVFGTKIYAVTENSIYTADQNSPNLTNYESWQTVPQPVGATSANKQIFVFGNNLILHNGYSLFSIYTDNQSVNRLEVSAESVFSGAERLIVQMTNNQILSFNQNFEPQSLSFLQPIADACYNSASDEYWFGTADKGVVQFARNTVLNSFKPDGPASNIPYELSFEGQRLFLLHGGYWGVRYGRAGYLNIFENEKWTVISPEEIQQAAGSFPQDLMNVAAEKNNPKHFFATSFSAGLFEFENDKPVKRYNHTNSNIQAIPDFENNFDIYTWTNSAIFDTEGNLFIANMSVQANFKILQKNGQWIELAYSGGSKQNYGKLLISKQNQNQKWVLSQRHTSGILVFDDNGTLNMQSDDRSIFLNSFIDTDQKQITPANYFCMTQDKNGTVWVGTEQGPLLFSNYANIYNGEFTCSRVKIPRNDGTNNADYLLQNERINAIAIDGGNRKWIGTENSGVFLLSENGIETIRHFTAENSPLPSNTILSIAINPVTGEAFFGTANGLISYQSDAAESADVFANVHAYPNPVRPQHKGMITITGLVPDTRVKITDINGNLIYETSSNGSIAVWDGKNLHGTRVATGIYLAVCVTEDGSQNAITKIMVIN